jgi:dihydropteroate synthase
MAATCAELQCGVILMHARGRPVEWKSLPRLAPEEVVPLVRDELAQRRSAALAAGIAAERIVLDPGFGFGKIHDANYPLLHGIPEIAALGQPVLAGVSRKSFLGHTLAPLYGATGAPVTAREHATLAATAIAILMGASLVRVHQVRPAVEAALIADATLAAAR